MVTLHECYYNVLSWSKSGDYKEKQVDEKYRKVFVTAHVVVRTAVMFLDSALNRENHSPEIFKNGLQCWEQFLCLGHSLTTRRP